MSTLELVTLPFYELHKLHFYNRVGAFDLYGVVVGYEKQFYLCLALKHANFTNSSAVLFMDYSFSYKDEIEYVF